MGGLPAYQVKAHRQGEVAGTGHRTATGVDKVKNSSPTNMARARSCGVRLPESACGITSITAPSSRWGGSRTTGCRNELAEMADPFYNQFARGGEGHSRSARTCTTQYTTLPHGAGAEAVRMYAIVQSDGVQSAVVNRELDEIIPADRNLGRGRSQRPQPVQMALGEAKAKAEKVVRGMLHSTGKTLPEIREYIEEAPGTEAPVLSCAGSRTGVEFASQRPSSSCTSAIGSNREKRSWQRSARAGATILRTSGDLIGRLTAEAVGSDKPWHCLLETE